jgi:type II secretory ATPase GspE/PulE/Tfp pilus assembly ATPase PilB-like protein
MEGALGPEQRQIIGALRQMRAGILLVQGPGGTGKTKVLGEIMRLYYRLEASNATGPRKLGGE